ncbi:MAG TPA: hypothetical protein DCW42_08275 [Bacteroidetes bacterium]|nr:hypothetical protein [Bacteroidota bacterium]
MFDEKFNYPEEIINGELYLEILDADKLTNGKGVKVELSDNPDDEVAVFLINSELFAVSNTCPHKHTREIYEGAIEDLTVSCPFHGWEFSLETGENMNPRFGGKSLKIFDVIKKENKIYIKKPGFEVPKWIQNM